MGGESGAGWVGGGWVDGGSETWVLGGEGGGAEEEEEEEGRKMKGMVPSRPVVLVRAWGMEREVR